MTLNESTLTGKRTNLAIGRYNSELTVFNVTDQLIPWMNSNDPR